ncbi:MAG: hypothetical protein QOE92_1470 [Chloroflexota bacterium]|nr:hypothetical protein [Chloroflexota bacterium]
MIDKFDALATEVLALLDSREIILSLVRGTADLVDADRCTLTSVDQHVLRVEASYEPRSGSPSFVGQEYELSWLDSQPSLKEAIEEQRIVLSGGFLTVARTDPDLTPHLVDIRHTATVPLLTGDEVTAVLILSRREDRPFSIAELEPLQRLGMMALLALRNARLFAAVQDAQERGLRTLTLMSEHAAAAEDLTPFFSRMSASVAQLVQAERAAFWMLQEDELVAQPGAHGFPDDVLAQMRVPTSGPGTEPITRIFGGEALGGEIGLEALEGPFGHVLKVMEIRDVIAVPWRTADRVLGMLMAANSSAGFSSQDTWVLRVSARASALVWQRYEAERKLLGLQELERQTLEAHAERMEELEKVKSQFLRLASHELRGPLTVVRGYISMMEEGSFGPLPPEVEMFLPTLLTRAEQMNRLIEQMLMTARLEDRRMVLNNAEINVGEVIAGLVGSLDGLMKPTHEVVYEPPDHPVTAWADGEKVETIIANLLSNALKYSPDGGQVKVTAQSLDQQVIVAVHDQGIGISTENLPRLFERFGRIEGPLTTSIEGTGLGLFLSRELARLQGGNIAVASEEGKGSVFTLTLPATMPVADDTPAPEAPPPG